MHTHAQFPAPLRRPDTPPSKAEESGDPITDDDELEWACEDCSASVATPVVDSLNNQVSETLQLMEMTGLTPDKCEKFLIAHLRVLHPQHAHMLDVKHSLLHLLGHHEGHLMADLTDKQLLMKEEIARSILQVADRLLPGTIHSFFTSRKFCSASGCIK